MVQVTEESPRQIRQRVRRYSGQHARLVEYFADGTCRKLSREDPLDIVLLAAMPLPEIQGMMRALRYFLFDLQNSKWEVVQDKRYTTMADVLFCSRYAESFGLVILVQASANKKFALEPAYREPLVRQCFKDEAELQQNLMSSGDKDYLIKLVNRVCANFRRELKKIELQEHLEMLVVAQYPSLRVYNGGHNREVSLF